MPLCLLTLLACAEPALEVHGVEPTQVEPGRSVVVRGAGFTPVVQVRVGVAALLDVQVDGPASLTGYVPELAEGSWDLVVRRGEAAVVVPAALVVAPRQDPCAPGYDANTQLSLARGQAVVDRFWEDGRRDALTWPLARVVDVELEDGPGCQALYLRDAAGQRLLFDADPEGRLGPRAERLSTQVERPLVVTFRR